MKLLYFISESMIPLTVVLIVVYGLLQKNNVYQDFLSGAKDGFHTVIDIMPTLIGLMTAVGILRASGFLDFFAKCCSHITNLLHFPSQLVPLAMVKMFSSSAATSLLLDLYKEHGTDSFLGFSASVMLSSTETIFYTMSIYFLHVGIKKTRFTLPGAIIATLAGIIASVVITGYFL